MHVLVARVTFIVAIMTIVVTAGMLELPRVIGSRLCAHHFLLIAITAPLIPVALVISTTIAILVYAT